MYIYEHRSGFSLERGLGQSPASASYNLPGLPFDPKRDYILAPEVLDAVEKVLSTPIPQSHLATLGTSVNPLMLERGLTIHRYPNGSLYIGSVRFGSKPRKTATGNMVYPTMVDVSPLDNVEPGTGKLISQVPPWLFVHTHTPVEETPGIPSGVRKENTSLYGDLYSLQNHPTEQLGILTIGVNTVIANFRTSSQPIPFSLAIRDPIRGPTNLGPTEIFGSHKAAARKFRWMYHSPTVTGYYAGDLRTGRAMPV